MTIKKKTQNFIFLPDIAFQGGETEIKLAKLLLLGMNKREKKTEPLKLFSNFSKLKIKEYYLINKRE